ncbi:MAG: phosphonate C-P lyase system protein PhnH [Cyanothece sp. SIO2G6]|nr:phosphonate C-P lyase system protein PhnH [Cyanothece sp. SIO2G6]
MTLTRPNPTLLPGFTDPVHGAQRTFRALLDALARPGMLQPTPALTAPLGLTPSCAAACLTLLDLETQVWLQPQMPEAVRAWLLFHTGCRFTADPQMADFAVISDVATAPDLDQFCFGTPEYPEASTSLLIQLSVLTGGQKVTLQGPGILEAIAIYPPFPPEFWTQWQAMTTDYPLGLDVWCFAENQILGLPRTSRLA